MHVKTVPPTKVRHILVYIRCVYWICVLDLYHGFCKIIALWLHLFQKRILDLTYAIAEEPTELRRRYLVALMTGLCWIATSLRFIGLYTSFEISALNIVPVANLKIHILTIIWSGNSLKKSYRHKRSKYHIDNADCTCSSRASSATNKFYRQWPKKCRHSLE